MFEFQHALAKYRIKAFFLQNALKIRNLFVQGRITLKTTGEVDLTQIATTAKKILPE